MEGWLPDVNGFERKEVVGDEAGAKTTGIV